MEQTLMQQLEPFLVRHPGRGTLRVQVSTGQGTFPVPQALVEVSVLVDGQRLPLYRLRTDGSGIVDDLALPTQAKSVSQNEETARGSATLYTVSVSHPGFLPLLDRTVALFDGVETILPANLQPTM